MWCTQVLEPAFTYFMPPGNQGSAAARPAYEALRADCGRPLSNVLPSPNLDIFPGTSVNIWSGSFNSWWVNLPGTQHSFSVDTRTPVEIQLDFRTLGTTAPTCMDLEVQAVVNDVPQDAIDVYQVTCVGRLAPSRTFAMVFQPGANSLRFRARTSLLSGPPRPWDVNTERLRIAVPTSASAGLNLPIDRSFGGAIQNFRANEPWVPFSISGTAFYITSASPVNVELSFESLVGNTPLCIGFEVQAIIDGNVEGPIQVFDNSPSCLAKTTHSTQFRTTRLSSGVHVVEFRARARGLNGPVAGVPIRLRSLRVTL